MMGIVEIISLVIFFSSKGIGSNLNCCFEILRNQSVSYYLSDPPAASCKSTWSANEIVVVDAAGNIYKEKVVHFEPQKLILRGNNNENVIYRMDCLDSSLAYVENCSGPCGRVPSNMSVPRATTSNQPPSGKGHEIISILVPIFIVFIIIIIIIVICRQRNMCQTSNDTLRCLWKTVPINELQLYRVQVETCDNA